MFRAGDEATNLATMSPISVPPNPSDHFKGCCAEMITFLAVIYFLKSVLNFDVFWGPSHLHKHRARGKTEDQEEEEEEKGKLWPPHPVTRLDSLRVNSLSGEEEREEESFTPDISEEDSDLDLGEEGGDQDNELTADQSYDVSAWGLSSSDDSDQEAHTSLTNISDDQEEEEELRQISVELVKDSDNDTGSNEDQEDDSTYKTEWYCQYEEQKRLLESSNKRCSNTTDFDSSDTLTEF